MDNIKPKQAENDNINAEFAEKLRNRPTDGLIRKQDALDALMKERQHLLANNQPGAEHILTHHGYNVIDELPTQEIIYCMDCKYFCKKSGFCTLGAGRFVYEEDFCSQAEKRGEADGTD